MPLLGVTQVANSFLQSPPSKTQEKSEQHKLLNSFPLRNVHKYNFMKLTRTFPVPGVSLPCQHHRVSKPSLIFLHSSPEVLLPSGRHRHQDGPSTFKGGTAVPLPRGTDMLKHAASSFKMQRVPL